MAQEPGKDTSEVSRQLIGKLRSVQRVHADSPENDRRSAFRETLREELGELPSADEARILADVREQLIREARERDRRVVELEQQVQALTAERDRLSQQNESLKQGQGGTQGSGNGEAVEKIRDALRKMTKGKQVAPDSVGLSGSEAQLLSLMQELLRFALDYEMGVNSLMAEFSIGPAAEMDTKMIKGLKQLVRDRFRACLDNKQGAQQALKEALARNARFVVDLNGGYNAALSEGTRGLLEELEPQPILDEHKRMLGFDYEAAWKVFVRQQGDLINLTRSELWERYYSKPFQAKLSGYLDAGR